MALDVLPTAERKRDHVRQMFDRIAPRYDALNRVLSGGLDQRWRRVALEAVQVGREDRVLDLACGTGDLARGVVARGAEVVGVDFAGEMLRRARVRLPRGRFVQADAARLPLPEGSVSVTVCGFALRNFVALEPVFAELGRVLAAGGRLALLDVDRPQQPVVRLGHSLYFDRLVPLLGGLVSDRTAYRYLPKSTQYLPPDAELLKLVQSAGFERVEKRRLFLGAAQLVTAVRGAA
ncbi:MAG: ubiquinone/menaquinone biosynthesis methyltransferase [Proteobacteria bacterium]|nr:ubiquinone/menaquinone biosynthesis methyltransferase [Pseudomonadota bacterium]